MWRSALFIAFFHDSPQLRVMGVDARIGVAMESAIDQLCSAGWYSGPACRGTALAYETVDEGRGWYRFHHHHMHVSLTTRDRAGFLTRPLPANAVRPLPVGHCGHTHGKLASGLMVRPESLDLR